MVGLHGSRLRKVALTGALAPGLVLGTVGAVGFGLIPGVPVAPVAAQSVLTDGACNAFSAPVSTASDLSVADVAEQANPAVVTILNMQPLSAAEISGIDGIEGIPGLPEVPGVDELPGIDELPGADDIESAPQVEDPDTLVPIGTGSGFIVDELGHAITNAHVVYGAEELTAVLSDGTEVPATVIGSDSLLDVAVLQLDLPSGTSVPGVVSFGDSESLRAGEEVVAIGNALGAFPNTVSEGTVNGVDRAFPDESGLTTMIQHDAEIWHGNSGGPLLNLRGEVVGVNAAGIGSSTMGVDSGSADMAFAVEGNTVCKAAADLLEDGEIVWPYLGIEGQLAAEGQVVADVVDNGPADDAGIQVGDVITAFNDQSIGRGHSLLDLLFAQAPGDQVTLTVDRNGTVETFQVALGERPENTD
jgi:S1-C subfamily serine protease